MTTDTDKDGMPDWWETFYGFDPKNATDATADADGDNITNLDEYKGKTNPTKSDKVVSGDDDVDDDTDDDADDDTDDDTETKDAWASNTGSTCSSPWP